METILPEGSPLAIYLEGRGEAEPEESPANSNRSSQSFLSFAPRGFPKPFSKIVSSARAPALPSSPVGSLRRAYASAISSTLGSSDNEHFLEHFRYILIGSQLLNEHSNTNLAHLAQPASASPGLSYGHNAITLTGATSSALLAFAFTWTLSWATDTSSGFHAERITIFLALTAIASAFLVTYARRQWLQYLRKQAIDAASEFISDVQSFDTAQISTITLIQEVELVSRGYKISNPLPPVSRIESHGQGQIKRCPRLRRSLDACYASLIPAMIDAIASLKSSVNQDDLDRFLDVYDIHDTDLEESFFGHTPDDDNDDGSLKHLRIHQHRYHTLRRALLCSLLALPATGQTADAARWRAAMDVMGKIKESASSFAETLMNLLAEDDQKLPTTPSSPSSPSRNFQTPTHARVRSQIRRISALSTGIRSLQAKLYLLREDSTRALSTPTSEADLEDVSTSLREQYSALGSDLQTLMQAWEADKNALSQDINRQRRRVSRSGSLTDETSTLSRPTFGRLLTSVDEDAPTTPGMLKPLPGEVQLPLSPPATEDGSDASKTDDEVFEAMTAPKPRPKSTLTREERIVKMHEEREKSALQKEKREANTHMLKELQSVINLRQPVARRIPHGRITSI
ncbi:MAG: hypothetical protein M1828_004244 [Chrysothrix sp. TS-e1954]|nr:MAG: hypothetical protein M1828_004244 [Chrysothrix sp. TS-e1954]